MSTTTQLPHGELLALRRWNTPTIYNGWERVTKRDIAADGFNLEETTDFMPELGAMVGYAHTVVFEPSNRAHPAGNPDAWAEYRRFLAAQQGPRIVVVQDLDKPRTIGAFWGEVNSSVHRALGCVGTIIDGAIRDVDDMRAIGFKALARRMCVGHAHSHPVRWGCPVEVFGRRIEHGQLIHADKHGFLAIPAEDEANLLAAARFLDDLECRTVIPAAREAMGRSRTEALALLDAAGAAYGREARAAGGKAGEWGQGAADAVARAAAGARAGR